ncbi:MAG: PSD1 and planctomycete cytochrome C domain-containing protein [Bryobacteraceae bacterium]
MLRVCVFVILATPIFAQTADNAFFEAKIRPVLVQKCYACHASTLKSPMSGLSLDTKAGVLKGGASGRVLTPGKPDESRLLKALSYTDELKMPPSGKLPDSVIADFKEWIASGAPDPRTAAASTNAVAPLKGMSLDDGRKWWAFQPVSEVPVPKVRGKKWVNTKIDAFILARLEQKKLKPSPPADRRTLVTRAYVDLLGYKPTYEETAAFVNDSAPDAWSKLIDTLQASPHYGERWARRWMDVARYGEDNPTSEATNPPYLYAWRYRDWIIEALNKDVPYDRFVKLQLAADLMPGTPREDLRALGYLGAAPIYHKDQRLSADVIGGFMTDDWDERVDAVSRGLLGMTVACARCHDHKFDPIPTKDYYGLVGVFASTMRVDRPLFDVDPEVERRYLWLQRRLTDLRYSANILTNEASTVVGSEQRVDKWKAEIETLKAESLQLLDRYPQLVKSLEPSWTFRKPGEAPAGGGQRGRNRPRTSTEPYTNAVYDAAQYVDGSDPQWTFINYKAGEARDFPVLLHGNVATPGETVPRHFLSVLAKTDPNFHNGSGRLELGGKIFSEGAPLAARIVVNRVWGWHFGRPLAATPSDFGVQGEKPSHPELLNDLAARFIAHGWSLKWLNREIMMSAAYRQSSHPRADGENADPLNALVWRMNPRRLDVESYRDTLLRSAGILNEEMYGPSEEVEGEKNFRRTVYGRVSRGRLDSLLKNYDFPDPMQTAGTRDLTTTSLQQLFVMNSPFMHDSSAALAASVKDDPGDTAKMKALYRKILARDPSPKELDLALTYLANGAANGADEAMAQYAQVVLSTNEEIFWP